MFVLRFRRSFPSSLAEGSPHTLIAHLFFHCFHPSRDKVITDIRLHKGILHLAKLRSKRRNPSHEELTFGEEERAAVEQQGSKYTAVLHCFLAPCACPSGHPQRRGHHCPHQTVTSASSLPLLQNQRAFPWMTLQLSTELGANLLEL